MRVLLATDAFPPVCGGSGWSTYELARGLRRRGHDVTDRAAASADSAAGVRETTYDGFRVVEFGAPAPPMPYVRNYFKNERLYADARRRTSTGCIAREHIDIVHGQHVMTSLPAIDAARRGDPVVCTVRDYWPVCYWSDLIHTAEGLALCPRLLGGDDDAVRPAACAARSGRWRCR